MIISAEKKLLKIQVCFNGEQESKVVECIWIGENLAVHKKFYRDCDKPKRNRSYVITHIHTGMSAASNHFVRSKDHKVPSLFEIIGFAGQWDHHFSFKTASEASNWELKNEYKQARSRIGFL